MPLPRLQEVREDLSREAAHALTEAPRCDLLRVQGLHPERARQRERDHRQGLAQHREQDLPQVRVPRLEHGLQLGPAQVLAHGLRPEHCRTIPERTDRLRDQGTVLDQLFNPVIVVPRATACVRPTWVNPGHVLRGQGQGVRGLVLRDTDRRTRVRHIGGLRITGHRTIVRPITTGAVITITQHGVGSLLRFL